MSTQILLIDPDISFMVGIKTALESTGEYQVRVASTMFMVDEQLMHGAPDVAVIAFDMPDIDIMELLQHIRQMRPDLPLVVTPYGSHEYERAPLLGAQEILGKPYTGRELITIVRAAMNPPQFAADESSPSVTKVLDPQALPDHSEPGVTQRLEPERVSEEPDWDALSDEPDWGEPPETGVLDPQMASDQYELPDALDTDATDTDDPRPAAILEEFEALERIRTGLLHAPEDESPPELILRNTLDQVRAERHLDETRVLNADDDDEVPPTDELEGADHTKPTRRLGETQYLSDESDDFELDQDMSDEFYDPYDPYGESAPIIERSDMLPQTKPLPARYDEPAFKEGDTPSVPEHDSEAMRTFLATDQREVPPDDFSEALGAIARTRAKYESDETDQKKPDQFRDLVDSMRPTGREARLSRLEELIQSLGTDFAEGEEPDTPEAGVDFVLDAMRQGKSPLGNSAPLFEMDDATIGEVIDGLFGPSFNGVLAAMSGESVDEDAIQEPTYVGAEYDEDHDMTDRPASLPEGGTLLDELGIAEPPIQAEDSRSYPATAALTALSAASGDMNDTGRSSLDALLDEIEAQLPPARSHRPRLKPLPSWRKSDLAFGVRDVAAMFDHVEGVVQPPTPAAKAAAATPLEIDEPDISQDDTVPSQALLEAMESVQDDHTRPSPPVIPEALPEDEVEYETKYYTGEDAAYDAEPEAAELEYAEPEHAEPDDAEAAYAAELARESIGEADAVDDDEYVDDDEDVYAETGPVGAVDIMGEAARSDESGRLAEGEPPVDEFDTAFEIDFDTDMLTMEDLLALADLPDDAGTEEIQREIMERAAAAARAMRMQDPEPELELEPEAEAASEFEAEPVLKDDDWVADDDVVEDDFAIAAESRPESVPEIDHEAELERAPSFDAEDTFDAESDEAAYYADLASDTARAIFPPDESKLVPLDSDTAAMIIETGASSVDDLEQYEDEEDDAVLAAIAVQLTQFSLESSVQATMISRPGQRLAEAGDLSDAAMDHLFELVERAWVSSQTSDSLIRYITLPGMGECLLYSTRVEMDLILSMVFNASTSVRMIRKQARRLSESLELVPEETESAAAKTLPSRPTNMVPPEGWDAAVKEFEQRTDMESIPQRPGRDEEVVYTAYTCLWLPADPTLELLDDLAEALGTWIDEIAVDNAWDVDDLAIFPDYVLVSLRAPEDALPDRVITALMDETAGLCAEYFPETARGSLFWTDGYYMVSPPRELSDREIARFITYQRQAQLG